MIKYLHHLDKCLTDLTWVVGRLSDHELVILVLNQKVMSEKVLKNVFDVLDRISVLNPALCNWMLQVQQV